MKTKNLLLIAIALLGLTVTSCKKEKVKGCTTSSATNFNADAEEDDGSCKYEGSMVFWQSPPLVSINVYLDGQLQGNSNVTFSSAPSCGNTGALTVKKDLGSSKSKSYQLTVSSNGGAQTSAGTVTFEANTCTAFEMQ